MPQRSPHYALVTETTESVEKKKKQKQNFFIPTLGRPEGQFDG